jgi:hypothetical protein
MMLSHHYAAVVKGITAIEVVVVVVVQLAGRRRQLIDSDRLHHRTG